MGTHDDQSTHAIGKGPFSSFLFDELTFFRINKPSIQMQNKVSLFINEPPEDQPVPDFPQLLTTNGYGWSIFGRC